MFDKNIKKLYDEQLGRENNLMISARATISKMSKDALWLIIDQYGKVVDTNPYNPYTFIKFNSPINVINDDLRTKFPYISRTEPFEIEMLKLQHDMFLYVIDNGSRKLMNVIDVMPEFLYELYLLISDNQSLLTMSSGKK